MKSIFTIIFVFVLSTTLHAKNAPALSLKITGTVIEKAEGEAIPIPFANVMCKGTTVGTFAGTEGNFTLNLKEGKHTIVVSCVGYKPIIKTIKVKKNASLDLFNIKLEPTNQNTASLH